MNFLEAPKQRIYNEILEERAIEFHGHNGSYMVIGLRMGLTALEMLDCKGWFDLECEARLHWNPPDSCVIDGIQSSTGCTMGKKNINVVEQPGIMTVFRSEDKVLILTLRSKAISKIKESMVDEDTSFDMIKDLVETGLDELFEITLCRA